jgi:NTE family protein
LRRAARRDRLSDLLCSDLNSVRLSRAAATSSAVPVVLSALTYDNYGGSCGYRYPAWIEEVRKSEGRARPTARAFQRYKAMESLQDSQNRPYIHVVDGGVADNIGVRGVIETLEELGASAKFRGEVGFGVVRRIVLLVVNSHASPRTDWDREEDPPGMIGQLLQASGVPIDRYSFESVESLKDRAEIHKWRRELLVARARLAGKSEAEADSSVPKVDIQVVDIAFDAIRDAKEREYFMNLPTSFVLAPEQVDHLREIAGRLLRASPDYQVLVREMGGTPAK